MASSHPIVRQVKWLYVIPQFIILILVISVFYFIGAEEPLTFGALTYLIISLSMKIFIPKHQRKGMKFIKRGQYEKALQEFQKSYDFFLKYKWIDKYKYLILLSASRISYLEMSMLNMAYCHAHLGDGSESKELYQKVLELFPDSKMAQSALKIFDVAKNT